jgi:HPt (histidine-containing phosphotransfer) domain-containing protein
MDHKPCKYDIQGLIDELEVEVGDIAILFLNYITEMKEEIAEMKELHGQQDWFMLERVVHNVKGVSANLGIQDVYEEAQIFDICLKNNQTEQSAECIGKIDGMLYEAEKEIKLFFSARGFSL